VLPRGEIRGLWNICESSGRIGLSAAAHSRRCHNKRARIAWGTVDSVM
jgi:hypothetical protein